MACFGLDARARRADHGGRCGDCPSDGHASAEAEFGGCVTLLHSSTQKSGHNVECGDGRGG